MRTIEKLSAAHQRHQQQPPRINGCEAPGYLGIAADFLRISARSDQAALEAFKHEMFSNLLIFDTYDNARECNRKQLMNANTHNPQPPTALHAFTRSLAFPNFHLALHFGRRTNPRHRMVGLDKVTFVVFPNLLFRPKTDTTQLTCETICSLLRSLILPELRMLLRVIAPRMGQNLVSDVANTTYFFR